MLNYFFFQYCEILIISSGLTLYLFKRPFCWAYFRGSLFSEGLIIGRNFALQKTLHKQPKTGSANSPWAHIQKSLLSEGNVRLNFKGLISGRAYFFSGGGGVGWEGGLAYYRNFTV